MAKTSSPRPRREFRGTGIYWSLILAAVITVGILIAIVANLQLVEFHYVGAGIRAPLIVILLVTIAATAVLTEVMASFGAAVADCSWLLTRKCASCAGSREASNQRGASRLQRSRRLPHAQIRAEICLTTLGA